MESQRDQYFNPDLLEKDDDPRQATQAIVGMICKPRDPSLVGKAEEARKRWSATLEMSDQDWAAAADYWATYDQYDDGPQPLAKGYAGLDPVDQYLLLANYERTSPDGHYVADAAQPLSELGRLGYASWCLKNAPDKEAHLAACLPDLERVNIKKISEELRADTKHPAKVAYMAHLTWYRVQRLIPDAKARRKKLESEDPAYAKMFAIADKAHADWQANASKRQKLISLAGEVDNARITQSRKATAGCEDKILPELRNAVSLIPAERFNEILATEHKMDADKIVAAGIVSHPDGYLAGNALAGCLDAEKGPTEHLGTVIGAAMISWPGYRGPHSAALADIMQAGLELDRRDATIGYPSILRSMLGNDRALGPGVEGSGLGVIAAVKPSGKDATVSFQNKQVTYPTCVDYRAGTRITGIMANGQFERAGTCYKYKQVTGVAQIPAVKADARFVSGLKPGQTAVVITSIPFVSWVANAKATATVLGVPVK